MASTGNVVLNHQAAIIVGVISVVFTALATYLYQKVRKPRIPTEWKAVGKVSKLFIYPLKSGRRNEVDEAECTKRGLMEVEKPDKSLRLRDRSFVIYHEDNLEYRTSRQYSKLILASVKAYDANSVLFNAPNMEALLLRIPSNKEKEVIVKHYKQEQIPSIDCGDDAAIWISQYILGKDRGLRIAYHDGSYKRTQINKLYKVLDDYYKRGLRNESGGLNSDLAAMHIINNASVVDLNNRIETSNVTAENFRPNMLVDGPGLEPYEEDNWEWIKIGNVVMKNVLECLRCTIPTIDIETGIRRKDREPSKTMEKFRISKGPEKSPVMGVLLEVFETGLISVGDSVYVGKTL